MELWLTKEEVHTKSPGWLFVLVVFPSTVRDFVNNRFSVCVCVYVVMCV